MEEQKCERCMPFTRVFLVLEWREQEFGDGPELCIPRKVFVTERAARAYCAGQYNPKKWEAREMPIETFFVVPQDLDPEGHYILM